MIVLILVLLVLILSVTLLTRIIRNGSQHNSYMTLVGGNHDNKLLFLVSGSKEIKNAEHKLTFDDVKNEILWLDREWDKNAKLREKFNAIVPILHPFSRMQVVIDSVLVGKVKITNAFIKISEFIHRFNIKYTTMFDIASAPGMFIIAAQHLSKKEIKWRACSYFDEKNQFLGDYYKLFFKYPSHVVNLNLLDYEACDKLARNETTYDLVSGDVGYIHGYNELQEISHLNLQYSQARLAVMLVKKGGNVFLKMYSCITNNNIWLLNEMSGYFKSLYLWKPYSSRITNDETYIVGLNRNGVRCTLPATPKQIDTPPKNSSNYYKFYYDLAKFKNELVMSCINGETKMVNEWKDSMKDTINFIKSVTKK